MKYLLCLFSALLPSLTFAEDIDLYIGSTAARTASKPQVLLVFDNSGSMRNSVSIKTPYNKNTTYSATNGLTALAGDHVYYVKGDNSVKPIADEPTENRKFLLSLNSCKTARDSLAELGFYTGYVREYTFTGGTGSWQELPDSDASNVKIVECWDDLRLSENDNISSDADGNNVVSGYPIDGAGSPSNPQYYTSNTTDSNTDFGTGTPVTLYSDNYLRWHANTGLGTVNMSKMDIAKYSVKALVDSSPTVDFGLEVFNHNHDNGSRNGGRIVTGLPSASSSTNTTNLKNTIDSLVPFTWTPLCESIYEAYRYLSGGSVLYGDDDSDHSGNDNNHFYDASDHPQQDMNAQTGGSYISPYKTCSNEVFIILITDGKPTLDGSANTLVSNLPNITSTFGSSYLGPLAEWMHFNDINPNMPKKQIATLFTVGFALAPTSTAGELLIDAANRGGGEYLDAQEPTELLPKLQKALSSILEKDTSFTAPSVTASSFNRTESLDSVYMAMFTPSKGPRWNGNLKKLKVKEKGVVDRNDNIAIDSDGNIDDGAKTFWSTSTLPDAGIVSEGGVVEMLSQMTPSNRNVYSDLGTNSLLELTRINATSTTAYGSDTALAAVLGVGTADIDEYLNWAVGIDVDDVDKDGNVTEMREDVFGDPLHAKPIAVKYKNNNEVGVFIGTNAGAIHMFNDKGDTVTEEWAFMPKEFFKNIKPLRENSPSNNKIYGVDGAPTLFIHDPDGDGISTGGTDKAWIFFGLRRGGKGYYALDVTDKNNPRLLWHIDNTSTGFGELGQSWSKPKVAYSRINISSGTPKPVLILGGGYDESKDINSIGTADSSGRAVYMLDAESGDLLWSITPSSTLQFPGTDSIPSSIATLDSDSDGYIDRLYFGDTGGNLWRVDMFGDTISDWQVHQLASLGSDTVNSEDRRFFAEPSIARAIFTETFENTTDIAGVMTTKIHKNNTPFEAILIGSGDRTRPTDSDTNDKLFMIKDKNILTQNFTTAPTVITHTSSAQTDLYDYTNNPFQGLTENTPSYNTLAIAVSERDGWFIDLAGVEEKSVAKPVAIAGVAYYNSFTPASSSVTSCTVGGGISKLYAMNLEFGTFIYNSQRTIDIGETMVDEIAWGSFYSKTEDPQDPNATNTSDNKSVVILTPAPLEVCDGDGLNCGEIKLPTTRSYLVVTENN